MSLIVYFSFVCLVLVAIGLPYLLHIKYEFANYTLFEYTSTNVQIVDTIFNNRNNFWIKFIDLFAVDGTSFRDGLIFMILTVIVVYRFFLGLYQIPLAECINHKLSANANVGFFSSFIANIRLSIKYTLIRLAYSLFFDFFMIGIFVLLLWLFRLLDILYFAPVVFVIVFFLLLAFRQMFVCCWLGHVVVDGKKPQLSFEKSRKQILNHFIKMYFLCLVASIIVVLLNFSVGMVTFGFGLILTIPLSILLFTVLELVIYYSISNKRYYVDNKVVQTIV
ncbi:MAG: hypothetical protein FWF56_06395 [Firmicutes bacterium]|nr:hypothetical protein [Bacillota bacterium]MCL1953859.1 hypothetical protein [Bacillota bacterium]